MARTITEIQQQIIDSKNSYDQLATVDSDSKTADWRIWTYITAVAIWLLEKLFDQHKTDVNAYLTELKPHGLKWYYNKSLAFQYGHSLAENGEADYYDNSLRTEEEVEAAKVIKRCAVNEDSVEKLVQIKVAGEDENGNLIQLDEAKEAAFTAYMKTIKDGGVYLGIINRPATKLKLTLTIYYDTLVLNENGNPLTGGDSEPARDAVNQYLSELPFNGELVLVKLIDKLQATSGINIPVINDIQAEGNEDFEPVNVRHTPFAGYYTLIDGETNNLTINYIADV